MHQFTTRFLAIAAIFLSISLNSYLKALEHFSIASNAREIAAGLIFTLISLLNLVPVVLLTYLALFLPVSKLHHSSVDVVKHFLVLIYYRLVSRRFWNNLIASSKNVRQKQTETLLSILQRNKDTEYGKKMKFPQLQSIEDFKNGHPLCDFEQFSDYVERMEIKGEQNLITSRDVCIYYLSSGTTGKRKHIPGVIKSCNERMEGLFP